MQQDEQQHGRAVTGTQERLHQPCPPAHQCPITANSSGMGMVANNSVSHCFPLSAFFPPTVSLLLPQADSLCIISPFLFVPFSPILSLSPITSFYLTIPSLLFPSSSPLSHSSPPSKKGNRNPKEEQELNLCQCNGPRGYIWNQQITES